MPVTTQTLERKEEALAALRAVAEQAPASAVAAVVRALRVAASQQEKAPFISRALGAIADIAEESDKQTLLRAATATSDERVILAAIDESGNVSPDEIRAVDAKRWLLEAEGGVCSGEDLARELRLSRTTVDNRRKANKLIALDTGRHGFAYPVWQAHEGRVLPGLEDVLAALEDYGPWAQAGYLLSANSWLGGETPLAELQRGHIDRVLHAAEAYAQ